MDIEQIRKLCQQDNAEITRHVWLRLKQRNISATEMKAAVLAGEIIENYPDDYPYPSCLILGKGLHVVVGIGEGKLWFITAYRPDQDRWDKTLVFRKEQ